MRKKCGVFSGKATRRLPYLLCRSQIKTRLHPARCGSTFGGSVISRRLVKCPYSEGHAHVSAYRARDLRREKNVPIPDEHTGPKGQGLPDGVEERNPTGVDALHVEIEKTGSEDAGVLGLVQLGSVPKLVRRCVINLCVRVCVCVCW